MEEIVTKEDIDEIVKLYDYFESEDDFIKKSQKKFRLSEVELRIIYRIMERCFIKWT